MYPQLNVRSLPVVVSVGCQHTGAAGFSRFRRGAIRQLAEGLRTVVILLVGAWDKMLGKHRLLASLFH